MNLINSPKLIVLSVNLFFYIFCQSCGSSALLPLPSTDTQDPSSFTSTFTTPDHPEPITHVIQYNSLSGNFLITEGTKVQVDAQEANTFLQIGSREKVALINAALKSINIQDLKNSYDGLPGESVIGDDVPMTFDFKANNQSKNIRITNSSSSEIPASISYLYSICLDRSFS